jgi:6-phosphofructokinase 1
MGIATWSFSMKRIAILTSGGDAPGMNAAIRAVVRTSLSKGWEVMGIRRGFQGLINDDMMLLGARDVGGIIQLGGTILGSARSLEFKTETGREKAISNLKRHKVDALVVIGGNGSQNGALELHRLGFPVVGIASTIDNDLYGSDTTIGVDTALNIALEAIDRLKVTASSHGRTFLVEVMGRDCGYIALMTGIAGGAEAIIIPEVKTDPEDVAKTIQDAYKRGKLHALIVVAEGAEWHAQRLADYFKEHQERLGFEEVRATTLGHVQRGGAPSAFDRVLATRLGIGATDALAEGKTGVLVGRINANTVLTPLEEVFSNDKQLDTHLLELARILAQ